MKRRFFSREARSSVRTSRSKISPSRLTRTIPAGQIGNAKVIEVVTERWMSTDLQIPMSMKHNDPMMGTMTTEVTTITRGEPSASLFQVPSDYKIVTGKQGDMMYMTKP